MPELPEVETIRRVLQRNLVGRTIRAVRIFAVAAGGSRLYQSLLGQEDVLRRILPGSRVRSVKRRAKYLLIQTTHGRLLFHLGMTGQVFTQATRRGTALSVARAGRSWPPTLPDKHTHVDITFTGGMHLYYRDTRKFGQVRWLGENARPDALSGLGPEPLSRAFTPAYLRAQVRGRSAAIKALLLNQRLVAGIGNIYADEALFRAGIAPRTAGKRLNPARARRLHAAIRSVLAEAIRHRGTSMSDYYDPESRRGDFQARLQVYGQEGQPCPRCGQAIVKRTIAQRGTHWCRTCQP